MIGARRGSPLAVGHGDGEMFFGSDAIALAPFTDRITYLEDGDWVVLTRDSVAIHDAAGQRRRAADGPHARLEPPRRQGQPSPLHGEGDPRAARGRRPHARPLSRLRRRPLGAARGLAIDFASLDRLSITACGTAYLCRARRQILVRALRPAAGRHRYRLRVPLPRAAARDGRPGDRRLAVGRDRRHARLAPLREEPGADGRRGRQRPRIDHRARSPTSSCRRLPGPRSASPRPRPSPASSRRCRRSASPRAARAARLAPKTRRSWSGR